MKARNALLGWTAAFLLVASAARAQEPPAPTSLLPSQPPYAGAFRDLASDTWVGGDALGRVIPTPGTVRVLRKDRKVGIFYFLVHGTETYYQHPGPYDNAQYLEDNTQILKRLAGESPKGSSLYRDGVVAWWGEPAVGYFLADDPWVIRHNLQMIQDAGVDVLFFDVTNALTYPTTYLSICKVAKEMRQQGNRTPQIGFVTHARGGFTVIKLYDEFYSKGLYRDLWFIWDNKPLILGDPDAKMDDGSPMRSTVRGFFTWRYSWAWDPGKDKWQWLDNYPQRPGWHTNPNTPEEVPVSIAGHPTTNIGRSNDGHAEPAVDQKSYLAADVNRGIYFGKQWEDALKIDAQFIFVTGWNEWYAGKYAFDDDAVFAGHAVHKGDPMFVDEYNQEFSRDAMPMKGGHEDNYFMQLVENVRRFKGARPLPVAHGFQHVRLEGDFASWKSIQPEYRDAVGDTTHRDWDGWGGRHYTNTTGSNDITSAKVACDAKTVSFYVQTRGALTPHTDPNWMVLLIDADQNPKTGWNGYDYAINTRVPGPSTTTLKRLSDGKVWTIPYRAVGNQMQVVVPRALIGQTNVHHTALDFHWVDNAPIDGDIADWWYNGDSAPDGRFNYRYENDG